ncbi:flagellar biosynthetic protein FlhB [Palleronia aestuarii]|uniref:Flagellar biosynthetic protein FlhB n=1 Tax=Palleronia aestuarii TaxID=568105 RepID=A0A2W7N4T0_9RHOB|nr:flagellar type III secretion system protein FlhB [Palleronia aestuarii]PZX15080.1 flagellar biosynthetic protein FlhB [Palleronia aestuarii]
MSGGDDEGDDKQFDPSQKKLDDARKKGEIPRSTDLITTGAYAGLLMTGLAMGSASLSSMGGILEGILSRAGSLSQEIASGGGTAFAGGLMLEIGMAIAPWLFIPAVCALLSVIGQQALTVTGSKLQPKLNRISILSNAKNKFGRGGLFEFAKSTVKLLIYGVILFWFIASRMPQIMAAMALTPGHVTATFLELALTFLMLVTAVSLCLGGIDFLWQRAEHMRKNRMSFKEMKDEHKESEGDPHFKQKRRQRGYEIAMNQMLADVPEATVVIVNPTHYAVALKWSRTSPGAPLCVAKGVDEVAARIREKAAEAGVPIHSDPPTARALHAVVEIGEEVRPEHYAAVAVSIRFAEDMRRRARGA